MKSSPQATLALEQFAAQPFHYPHSGTFCQPFRKVFFLGISRPLLAAGGRSLTAPQRTIV